MKTIKHMFVITLLGVSLFSFSQNKIDLLILNKEYKAALTEIENQLASDPSVQLHFKKGLILNKMQKYQEALSAFSKALQLEPDNVDVLGEMAEGLSILGNNTDAVSFFKRATELDPENLALAGKLGRVYINQKEYKNGYNVFAGIYAKDSTNIYWNKQLAYCSFRIGRRLQAVRLYEKVLQANPRDYGTYINLIHTYSRKKESNEIMATIKKGLAQFPNDSELLLERANFFFKTKRYGPAMLQFEKYFRAEGDSIYDVVMNYAISIYFSNNETKALRVFNNLFRANPEDAIVQYYISLCNKKMKNFAEAEKMMIWAIGSSVPSYVAEMYHHLGQIYGQERKFKESIEALQKAYEQNSKNYEILFEIATTYEEYNSNKTLALNYYRLYLKEASESAKNVNYALDRITRIKEDLFFEE